MLKRKRELVSEKKIILISFEFFKSSFFFLWYAERDIKNIPLTHSFHMWNTALSSDQQGKKHREQTGNSWTWDTQVMVVGAVFFEIILSFVMFVLPLGYGEAKSMTSVHRNWKWKALSICCKHVRTFRNAFRIWTNREMKEDQLRYAFWFDFRTTLPIAQYTSTSTSTCCSIFSEHVWWAFFASYNI